MSILKECSFYRDSGTLGTGRGIGYCELGCDQTICDADIDFVRSPTFSSNILSLKGGEKNGRRKEMPPFQEARKSEHREGNRLL